MWESIGTLLHGDPVDKAEVKRMRDLVLFEGRERNKKIVKFFFLLILSSGIATYGLLGDSVAVVIGAMIIAPLMLPIMGLAFSISAGDSSSMKHSLLLSIGGIITAIAVGFFLTLPLSHFYQPESIEQVMVRTAPRLLDLLAALVTGFAGAFAMSRHDVSDTLPGVAIAISLVPPLANVGILLASSNYSLAMGSMLLFMTNYFAIIITGAVLFGVMGFSKISILEQSLSVKRKGIALALVMVLLISVPLGFTGYNISIDHGITKTVNDASNVWLVDSGYEVISTEITSDKNVLLRVIGDGELPALERLEEMVKGKIYGRSIKVEVVHSSTYHLNHK
ncbi:TIGR00341 family protein [Methanobacterium subterraneum]|uniref:TIGR00341 family protein n=1 Tax=Methanobacterium subterraneum TaxID=59277 RepID=A0A2H4VEZ4_9EURY|nr:TIGR00341 family protein [Methanobacterium subterraneum]AUB56669.1 TIGR00341 family protein [Methanobacterium subterraneum]MBW4257129.1 TIGR00341 family protein [Methanobacterium sp. YSL]